MLITLHPTYTLEVKVQPPEMRHGRLTGQPQQTRGEFWDGVGDKIAADDVLAKIEQVLKASTLGEFITVRLTKFQSESRIA